jgi:hypothetical protein
MNIFGAILSKSTWCLEHWNIGISNLFRISCFEFRA